jgi:hypothetical protein
MKTQIRKFIQKNKKYLVTGDCYEINCAGVTGKASELAIFIEYKGTLLISY